MTDNLNECIEINIYEFYFEAVRKEEEEGGVMQKRINDWENALRKN